MADRRFYRRGGREREEAEDKFQPFLDVLEVLSRRSQERERYPCDVEVSCPKGRRAREGVMYGVHKARVIKSVLFAPGGASRT